MRHLAFEKLIISSKIDKSNFFEKCVLELCRTAMIKPRQIERSDFFYWTTTDKLKFTDWSHVNRMLGCGDIMIFRQRMRIWKSGPSSFVGPPKLNQGR